MAPNSCRTRLHTHNCMLASLALALSLLLVACGSSATNGGAAGDAGGDTAQAEPLTEEEVNQWTKGGAGFSGREATVTGQVFNTERDGQKNVYQIRTDPKNIDGNTIVYYEGDDPGIVDDDYIRATGIVQDDMEYENAFGATMSAPLLKADAIEKVSYQDAVAPTIASIEPNINSEQNGYSITVQKIEFAKSETRVYVSLVNKGAGRLTVYDYSAVLIQDGKQINTETNYQADYPGINKELAVGASMEGIICFPAVEKKDMQLQMQGHSDNYEVDGTGLDFTFDIKVK